MCILYTYVYIYISCVISYLYLFVICHVSYKSCLLADRLPAHVLWMGWGGVGAGWGGVITYVAIASSRTCYATSTCFATTWEWRWGGVGWGNNVRCNCFVTVLLRHFYWTLMKDGIPKSLSSHCTGKPNPKLWKYIKIQQWRWEMGTCQLLSKTGRQLAML